MVIGSHNSWSFLRPRKWWMRLIAFTARCQRKSFYGQIACGVSCFDLRVRFDDNAMPMIVHGPIEYATRISDYEYDLLENLRDINRMGGFYVRIILDTRTKRQYNKWQREWFYDYCMELEMMYPDIKFWCGRNLYNWDIIYNFREHPTCDERYGSVTPPKWFWGICPWLYARIHNHKNIEKGTDKDILLLDYIDIK